jgi:glutamate synthase (NADPH/NADH) small chain
MGKATGFLEIQRETIPDRDPLERIGDWKEIHLEPNFEAVSTQAARCMDCGTPYCHTGLTMANMASGCPINNLIPEFNDLVFRKRWKEAYLRLRKTNNFPEFTGRVCPAPCEGSCVLGVIEPPVTIKNIECSIIDRAWDEGWVEVPAPKSRTGKKVAVVGSGPAGLSCAEQLNSVGHSVTVFERDDRIGGLLMYGIPNMKLDKEEIVQRRVDLMKKAGIEFVTDTEVGKDLPASALVDDFDAAILCIGATKPRDLEIEGRDLKGVHFAMEFLSANTKGLLDGGGNGEVNTPLLATGRDVIVIGGGDTGTDCVGTSVRHGCRSITQLEIMPQSPPERDAGNPWPQWPKIHRMDYGQEEAEKKFGNDPRMYCKTAKRFIGDADGNLEGIEIVDVQWDTFDDGRRIPSHVVGTEKCIPAQLALLAMGFLGPEDQLIEQLKLERDPRSNIKAEHGQYLTSIPGIFTAGDARRGQSLVVWAINEGRGAAKTCDRFLMGHTSLP